jgi:hypothetical protein
MRLIAFCSVAVLQNPVSFGVMFQRQTALLTPP